MTHENQMLIEEKFISLFGDFKRIKSEGKLIAIRYNIQGKLSSTKMKSLSSLSNNTKTEFEVYRSGTGLTISFG